MYKEMNNKKNNAMKQIARIDITYDRRVQINLNDADDFEQVEASDIPCVLWEYHESLTVDRKTDTICHHRKPFEDCDIANTYHISGGVSTLLDGIDADTFLQKPNPKMDVDADSTMSQHYRALLTIADGTQRTIEGRYDKNNLPDGWESFIRKVLQFFMFYGIGEMFEETLQLGEEENH